MFLCRSSKLGRTGEVETKEGISVGRSKEQYLFVFFLFEVTAGVSVVES